MKKYVENSDGTKDLNNYLFGKQTIDISKYFDLKGPRYTFNNACSASGTSVAYASQLIQNGEQQIMIAGGCDPMAEYVFAGFNALKALNKKVSTPYGENFGLNLGEGAAYFVIESKEVAIKRGAHIYAEILGYGSSNDAFHATAPDKNGKGIALAIKNCIKNSKIKLEDVKYINSHGTGTKANDSAEIKGIAEVFGKKLPYISSLKGYVGHNLGAAASVELALTLIGLTENTLYPNLGIDNCREGCKYNEIFKDKIVLDDEDIVFINNNAAFGGHNIAVSLIKRKNDRYDLADVAVKDSNAVYIESYGYIEDGLYKGTTKTGHIVEQENPLREYKKEYYERRMNALAQNSIIAADLAKEALFNKNVGLVFGTTLGSLNSTKKYIDSIQKKGLGGASSIYFPDLVLNSTAGKISKALNLKSYNASISSFGDEDMKALEIAFNALKNNYASTLLVGVGEEESELANKIIGNNKERRTTGTSFLGLVSENKARTSLAEIVDIKNRIYSRETMVEEIKNEIKIASDLNQRLEVVIHNSSEFDINEIICKSNKINNLCVRQSAFGHRFSDGTFRDIIQCIEKKSLKLFISISRSLDVTYLKLR